MILASSMAGAGIDSAAARAAPHTTATTHNAKEVMEFMMKAMDGWMDGWPRPWGRMKRSVGGDGFEWNGRRTDGLCDGDVFLELTGEEHLLRQPRGKSSIWRRRRE